MMQKNMPNVAMKSESQSSKNDGDVAVQVYPCSATVPVTNFHFVHCHRHTRTICRNSSHQHLG